MLLLVSVGWAVLQTGRFVIAPLLPTIIADLEITEATAGIALTTLELVYAATQYPSGRLSDSWGRKTLIVAGLVALVGGYLLFGVDGGYPLFVAAALVVGFGKGLFSIPSRALVSDLFVARRGRALGVYAAGTDVGGLLAAGLAVLLLGTWRVTFVLVAVALGLVTLLFVRWSDESYRVEATSLDLRATLGRLAASRSQRRTLVAYALFFFMVGGFINFFPTYLVQTRGFSPELASFSFAIVFVVGLAIKPVAGDLSDRFPRRRVATAGLVVSALALGALLVVESLLLVWVSIAVLALGYKTEFPLSDAIVMDDAPDGEMGADLGAARALFLGAGAIGPAFVGIVATYAGYAVAFGTLAVCLGVAAVLLSW